MRGAYGQPVEDILHELDKSSCSWDDPGALLRWNGELTSERPVLNASADRTSRSVVLPSSAAKAGQKIADKDRARVFGALVMHLREIHLLTDISEITKVVSGEVKKKNDKADV